MNGSAKSLILATVFSFGILAMTVEAQTPNQTKQDWSAYSTYTEIAGEVVKFEDPSITIKITKYQQAGGNAPRPIRPGQRPQVRPPQIKATTEEHSFTFHENALVRWYKLAPKIGADGRKVPHTPAEIQQAKLPQGAPGYAGNRSDLQSGQWVNLVLIRPRDIPLSKLSESDLQVKYAVILGYGGGNGDDHPAGDPATKEKKPPMDKK
jgi:hypothetical protein